MPEAERRRGAGPRARPGVRVHLWVSGRVQGIGFRDFVQREAGRLGLAGFVRNLPDRRVEIVAEGSEAGVDRLIEAARHGPPGAAVEHLDIVRELPLGESGFAIRMGGTIHD
jgi:acylphosphatase